LNQRAKEEKKMHISYTNHHRSIGGKKNSNAASPIVGAVGNGELKWEIEGAINWGDEEVREKPMGDEEVREMKR
jgi:hypothetical protein